MNRVYRGYEYSICVKNTTRTRHITYEYDSENGGFTDTQETIEKHLNHRSYSLDFLVEL